MRHLWGSTPSNSSELPRQTGSEEELRKTIIESKDVSLPAESPQGMTSIEPAIPSSPGSLSPWLTETSTNHDHGAAQLSRKFPDAAISGA